MVITKILAHFCPPPPYKFLSPLVTSFSLSLPVRLSFYLFLSHLVSGNRIEARQWIVARHLSCYNPLSCFTPFRGVKYDKIRLHDFFCVCNFFSFSLSLLLFLPSLSLFLSLSHPCLSTYLSLSLSRSSSLYLSLSTLSLFLSFFSRSCLSFHPSRLPLLLPLMSPCLSFSHPCLSFSISVAVCLSLSLPPPVSLPIFLSPPCLSFSVVLSLALSPIPVSLFLPSLSFYLSGTPASLPISISLPITIPLSFYLFLSLPILSLTLSLHRKKENIKLYCNIEKENL